MREGWKSAKLGEVSEMIKRGIAPKYTEEGGVCVINQKCIRGHSINYDLTRRHDVDVKKVPQERFIQLGDVMVNSTGTGTLGRVAQVRSEPDEPATVDTHVTIVRPTGGVFYHDFFGYMLIKIEDELVRGGEGASGQTELARSKLENQFVVSFPESIGEQKRIVAILDEAFEGIDTVVANTEKNLANVSDLFDRYLDGIFTKKRGYWAEGRLSELVGSISTGPFGSLLHKSDYVSKGVPLVNPINIIEGHIIPDDNKRIGSDTARRLRTYALRSGDIVIARRGEIGRCAVVREEQDGWLCGTGCFFIRPSDKVNPDFIAHLLRSFWYRGQLEKLSSGATMLNLSNKALSNLTISLPGIEHQNELVRQIAELAEECARVETIYQQKLTALTELKQSLLQKAFSGELTAREAESAVEEATV